MSRAQLPETMAIGQTMVIQQLRLLTITCHSSTMVVDHSSHGSSMLPWKTMENHGYLKKTIVTMVNPR